MSELTDRLVEAAAEALHDSISAGDVAEINDETAADVLRVALPLVAEAVEGTCDWRRGMTEGDTHSTFHFGYPCPYERCAALIREAQP